MIALVNEHIVIANSSIDGTVVMVDATKSSLCTDIAVGMVGVVWPVAARRQRNDCRVAGCAGVVRSLKTRATTGATTQKQKKTTTHRNTTTEKGQEGKSGGGTVVVFVVLRSGIHVSVADCHREPDVCVKMYWPMLCLSQVVHGLRGCVVVQ